MSAFPSSDGGIFGAGGPGDLTDTIGGSGATQQQLGPIVPGNGAGPTVTEYINLGTQSERVRLYLGGRYNRLTIQAAALDSSYPTSTMTNEHSMDGDNWFAASSPVTVTAAGITPGIDVTGVIWTSVRVSTPAGGGGRAQVTLSGSNTTA